MKFMITWKASPAHDKTAVERFLKTGAPAPKGLKTLGRWHTAGSSRGFHLVEGSDAALAEINATGPTSWSWRRCRSSKMMWPARWRRSFTGKVGVTGLGRLCRWR